MHEMTGCDAMFAVGKTKVLKVLQASEKLSAGVMMFGISPHTNIYYSRLERSMYQSCTVELKAV